MSLINTDLSEYNITYTGTPPQKQKFKLQGDPGSGVLLRIDFPKAGYWMVLDEEGVPIAANDFNDTTQFMNEVTGAYCGENRWIPVQNVLEFYITDGCELYLEPRRTVMGTVRLEWTMADFFTDGSTLFVDKLTSSLGIHPSTVKIAGVWQGSVVFNFFIIPEPWNFIFQQNAGITAANENFSSLQDIFDFLVKNIKTMDLGYPVLDSSFQFSDDANYVDPADPDSEVVDEEETTGGLPNWALALIGVSGFCILLALGACLCCSAYALLTWCGCTCCMIGKKAKKSLARPQTADAPDSEQKIKV